MQEEILNLVIAGHVDHGKSTIIGRLLADTDSLPKGKLEAVREHCRRTARPFEYAFLLDALKEEQAQGITIDAARTFFKTDLRKYMIIDAPGHIEFLKNMVTGASSAEAALLVIDAAEGVRENSRRHGFMLSFLGIRQICVLVNKMDVVNYDRAVFETIVDEYRAFLKQLDVAAVGFIPVSGREGDNIAVRSARMDWYSGPTVLQQLDAFTPEARPENKPLRMPVQDVYKFTARGDTRRIVAGRIETGRLRVGEEVVFYPSGKKSVIQSLAYLDGLSDQREAEAGWSVGFTLSEQIYVRRGEIATHITCPRPQTASRLKVSLFWLGRAPLQKGKKYLFKLGTAKVEMEVERFIRIIDASTLEARNLDQVERNDVAECILKLDQIVAFDRAADVPETGRFVIVDDYEISGGGVVLDAVEDRQTTISARAQERNTRWETAISDEERAERYNQKPCLVLISSQADNDLRKKAAKSLERKLFNEGKFTYYIGMANILYGLSADLARNGEEVHAEHFRRLAEVANLMLDAGVILVISARHISQRDIEILEADLIDRAADIITVWVGDEITSGLVPHLHIRAAEVDDAPERIKRYLQEHGYIFRYRES